MRTLSGLGELSGDGLCDRGEGQLLGVDVASSLRSEVGPPVALNFLACGRDVFARVMDALGAQETRYWLNGPDLLVYRDPWLPVNEAWEFKDGKLVSRVVLTECDF